MYVVFYNCYFHRYLKNYIPKWVITDLMVTRRYETPVKDSSKSTMSRTATSKMRSFSMTKTRTPKKEKEVECNMAESLLFLNPKVED